MKGDMYFFVEISVVCLLFLGACCSFIGALGFLRFKSFYERLHMPSLVSIGGLILFIFSYMIAFTFFNDHFPYRAILAFLFIFIITPLNVMMLSRGTLYREIFFFIQKQPSDKLPFALEEFSKEFNRESDIES